jgi:hypothetical protein
LRGFNKTRRAAGRRVRRRRTGAPQNGAGPQ